MEPIIFEGLDNVDRRIRELADDIGYLRLDEVTGRNTVELAGRIDFTQYDLAHFIDPNNNIDPATHRMAQGASAWLRRTVAENMTGRGSVKFKIGLWRPKGDGLMYSARFIAHNPNVDDDPDEAPREVPAPQPTIQMDPGIPAPTPAAWNALEHAMRNWLGILQESYAGLARAQSHHSALQAEGQARQSKENSKLYSMVEDMHGKLLLIKVGQAQIEQTGRENEANTAHREALAKQFLSELGSLGRLVAASKLGVSPELAELATIIEDSPDLKEALTDPDIRAMLKDTATAKELAALLKSIVAAEKARKATANTPPSTEQKAA